MNLSRLLLTLPLLGGLLAAQYTGEPPVVMQAAAANPQLGATALGVAQVQQILLVPHIGLGANWYYAAATVVRSGATSSFLQTGTFNSVTGAYTKNTDIDALTVAGDFALSISDDLQVAVWDAATGVKWAKRTGAAGPFGPAANVTGITGTYLDPNFGRINGKLVLFFITAGNTSISVGDFDANTGAVSNIRVVAAGSVVHSPTPMNDKTGETRCLVYNNGVSPRQARIATSIDNSGPDYLFYTNAAWLANGDCNGGTITLATAPSTYADPTRIGILAMNSVSVPAAGGPVTLAAFGPEKAAAATPYSGTILVGVLNAAAITLGPPIVGNLSLNPGSLVVLPSQAFDNASGSLSYSLFAPAQPSGTKLQAQPVLLDVNTATVYLGNTAQILWQ
ncbi:MAG: hypothetical protein IT458_14530 [Planctomycetes bacterium]|nr:hypothetical protein [Planctomycetota bacterium]